MYILHGVRRPDRPWFADNCSLLHSTRITSCLMSASWLIGKEDQLSTAFSNGQPLHDRALIFGINVKLISQKA